MPVVTSVSTLGLYETAYLCGGAQRVAVAAVVAMVDDGRLRISRTRHRVQVVRRSATQAVERAVLDAVPESGQVLGPLLLQITDSAAVKELTSGLRNAGLVGRHALAGHPHLSAAGRRARKELEGSLAQTRGERRVAVLGIGGITDARLRDVFENPPPRICRCIWEYRIAGNTKAERSGGGPLRSGFGLGALRAPGGNQ